MKAPCLDCELLDQDKSNPVCMDCRDRIAYVNGISRRTHLIPFVKNEFKEPMKTPEIQKKLCSGKCRQLLPLDAFRYHPQTRDKLEGTCRLCRNALAKEQYHIRKQKAAMTEPTSSPAQKPKQKTTIRIIAEEPPIKEITPIDQVRIKNISLDPPLSEIRGPKELTNKTDWAIFPFREAEAVVDVFAYGVKKYGRPFSYRDGIPTNELLSAIFRHAIEIQNGSLVDEESGQLHLAHIAANALMAMSKK